MRKRIIDLVTACVSLTVFGIAWAYPGWVTYRTYIMWLSGILALGLMILSFKEKEFGRNMTRPVGEELPSEKNLITEIVLLNEEDSELMGWNLYGETAALIGRDVKENEVDIDLSQGPYASMVEIEHAVLNFSAGNWYVEDLGSTNGLSLKKAVDGKKYHLSKDTPCRLEKGDCLYVGLNRLLLR